MKFFTSGVGACALVALFCAGCDPVETPAADALETPSVEDSGRYLERALEALKLGRLKEANESARKAVEADPSSAEALLAYGAVANARREWTAAKAAFASVAESKDLPAPLRSQAYVSLGVTYFMEGEGEEDFARARIAFWRGMRLNRRNAAAWYHLGVLSRDTWHFDAAALEQFQMFAALSPANDARTRTVQRTVLPAIRDAIQRTAAAHPGAAKRDPGKAAKLLAEAASAPAKKRGAKYKAAYEADPFAYDAAWAHARDLAAAAKTGSAAEKALVVFRDAYDAKPASQKTYVAAARCALAHRLAGTAVEILSRALAHSPESKETLDLYADALRRSGKGKVAALYQAYRREL